MDSTDQARLRVIVKEAIDQADPIGLLEIGCPDDEYDPEVERVLAHMLECSDPEALGERIHQVFIEMFDERIAGPPEVYGHIAQQIVEAMGERGGGERKAERGPLDGYGGAPAAHDGRRNLS